MKVYGNKYWKEHCFGLSAETLVDKACALDSMGGTYGGNNQPTPFLCLTLKLLQIQPEKDIIVEYIKNEDYKYPLPFSLASSLDTAHTPTRAAACTTGACRTHRCKRMQIRAQMHMHVSIRSR